MGRLWEKETEVSPSKCRARIEEYVSISDHGDENFTIHLSLARGLGKGAVALFRSSFISFVLTYTLLNI